MSIYSGFGTRQQEKSYNKTLYHLLFLLQLKVMKGFLAGDVGDEKFDKAFKKLYSRLTYNDNCKYLPPRFSYAMKDLAEYYGIFMDIDPQEKGGYLVSQSSNSSLKSISQLNSKKKHKKGNSHSSTKSAHMVKSVSRNGTKNLEIIKESINK